MGRTEKAKAKRKRRRRSGGKFREPIQPNDNLVLALMPCHSSSNRLLDNHRQAHPVFGSNSLDSFGANAGVLNKNFAAFEGVDGATHSALETQVGGAVLVQAEGPDSVEVGGAGRVA